jgi:hypothetical protein
VADADYDREHGWVIEIDGEYAGWVQYEEETYEWYPSVALDISLTTGSFTRYHAYGSEIPRAAATSRYVAPRATTSA